MAYYFGSFWSDVQAKLAAAKSAAAAPRPMAVPTKPIAPLPIPSKIVTLPKVSGPVTVTKDTVTPIAAPTPTPSSTPTVDTGAAVQATASLAAQSAAVTSPQATAPVGGGLPQVAASEVVPGGAGPGVILAIVATFAVMLGMRGGRR